MVNCARNSSAIRFFKQRPLAGPPSRSGCEAEGRTNVVLRQRLPERIVRLLHRDLAPPEAIPSGADDFVGREKELAALSRVLDDALRGRSQLALVTGEPGIGKTRLAA